MIESRIERLAEDMLAAHNMTRPPVDPLAVARLEGIRLAPGRYDGCFDGRIEYRSTVKGGRFYLFYAEEDPPRRPLSRVRFSVAHELGHYFLPAHREYLLSGDWHGSQAEFLSSRRLEREADWFAAALLMPRQSFIEAVSTKAGGVCRLADLMRLADRVFETSLTSTAIRYAQLNFAPCCVVFSERGQVLFSIRSDALKLCGWGWIGHIPEASVTGRLLAASANGRRPPAVGSVGADVWFETAGSLPLREEVRVLGRTGRTLTYLAFEGEGGGEG